MSTWPQADCVIREGHLDDATEIRQVLEEANLSVPAEGFLEKATHSRIGQIATLVCEHNREVAGVLQWRSLGAEVEILDLAVRPSHRRKGHGARLLKELLQRLAGSSVEKLFLEVRESNTAAVALYGKFGFQISGRRPNYYRNPQESALLMAYSFPV